MKKLLAIFVIVLFPAVLTAQEQFSVYFDTNQHTLTLKEETRLNEWIADNATSKVLAINGYTDEDGSIGLNDTLAQRRVTTVFSKVKGKVAAREDFKTRSFGKLHKQSPVKAENRKVTLYYLKEKDLARENEILGITETAPVAVAPKKAVTYPATVSVQGAGGKMENLQLDVAFMKKLGESKAGEKLRIQNLNFYENTFGIMPDSRPRLFELLEVMRANPALKIKLLGHVCCMTADRKDLSTQRAKAMMLFLNQNGIEKSRLSFQGFGVSQPLYPIPEKTPEEREANRRVEVLVVENP